MEKKSYMLTMHLELFYNNLFLFYLFVLDSLNICYSHLVPSLARISLLLHFLITFYLGIFHILALLKIEYSIFHMVETNKETFL